MSMTRATRRQLEADLERTRLQRDDALTTVRGRDIEAAAAVRTRYPDEVRNAVIAVAIRLEERADKRTLPNGAALCVVESLYERAAELRDLVGETTEEDEANAEGLLAEILGSR